MIEWLNENWIATASVIAAIIVVGVLATPKLFLKIVGRLMPYIVYSF